MAYLKDLRRKCEFTGCESNATYELRNQWDRQMQSYCSHHSKLKLRIQQLKEDKDKRDGFGEYER